MIQRKKWSDLLNNSFQPPKFRLSFKQIFSKLNNIDVDVLNEKSQLLEVWKWTIKLFGYSGDSTSSPYEYDLSLSNWKDMPIWISSFKDFSRVEFIDKLLFDLGRYIDSYLMLLSNDGFAKSVYTTRDNDVSFANSANDKSYFSETPQVSSNDQALDNLEYLSNASKDFTQSAGTSAQDEIVSTKIVSWEEAKKNMEFVYFRDICYYIMKIPYLVYDYFALDTYPAPEALNRFYENVRETLKDYE